MRAHAIGIMFIRSVQNSQIDHKSWLWIFLV